MMSGKTTALISKINRHRLAGRAVLVCKPEVDTRSEGIASHDGLTADALVIKADGSNLSELTDRIFVDVFAIDEVQFMPPALVPIVSRIALDRTVIAAGLDMDAFGHEFPVTASLLARAHSVEKHQAVCNVCGEDAYYSQRIVGGRPVTSGETVVIGGTDTYEARCVNCVVLP